MTLTPRQLEILRMHAEGHTSRDIRKALFVAENTIKTHNAAIRKKLGAHTMPQAVANAYEQGVLAPDAATVLRQLDSARAWAVALEQENAALSSLLRGMARRVGKKRRELSGEKHATRRLLIETSAFGRRDGTTPEAP